MLQGPTPCLQKHSCRPDYAATRQSESDSNLPSTAVDGQSADSGALEAEPGAGGVRGGDFRAGLPRWLCYSHPPCSHYRVWTEWEVGAREWRFSVRRRKCFRLHSDPGQPGRLPQAQAVSRPPNVQRRPQWLCEPGA